MSTFLEPSAVFKAVTPHATNKLEHGVCRGLYVGGAGTVVAYDREGNATTFTCFAGTFLPIKTDRVLNTSTATLIVALY